MARHCPHVALVLALLVGAFPLFATSHQDDQIIARARQAIGGEARLKAVTALSVKGSAQTDREAALRAFTNLRLDFLLPDRFLITRDWPLSFFRRIGGFNGEKPIERRLSSGIWADVLFGNGGDADMASQLAARRRECARYLVAWLLMAPQYRVEFTGAGPGERAGTRADVVEAKGAHGFAARLYFDPSTHWLLMLTYRDPVPNAAAIAAAPGTGSTDAPGSLFKSLEAPDASAGEVTMRFDDHHADDGIVFSHRIRIESDGLREEWKISKFQVNPRLDAKDFERK